MYSFFVTVTKLLKSNIFFLQSPVDDVFQERHIDDSMETDDCHSENSSQTSSNEDSQHGYHDGLANIPEEEFFFGKYEFAEEENFNIPVV